MIPQLALVPGEPAGIGPELCIRLAQQPRTECRLLAFAVIADESGSEASAEAALDDVAAALAACGCS